MTSQWDQNGQELAIFTYTNKHICYVNLWNIQTRANAINQKQNIRFVLLVI